MYPPCSACEAMPLVLVRVPPPQEIEQGEKPDHEVSVQCTGQGPSVQSVCSSSLPHATPPFVGYVSTIRRLLVLPVPQVSEHESHSDHADITQSLAQSAPAVPTHSWVSMEAAQATPPYATSVPTLRVRN